MRVAVADDDSEMLDYYRATLLVLGHELTIAAKSGEELLAACRDNPPDLAILDIKLPGIDGIETANELSRTCPVPVVLVSAYHDPELIERAVADHVLAYLIKPISRDDLPPAIAIASRRFQEFQHIRQEAADLRQTLEDRKMIEKAKGLVMQRLQLSEADAFRRLQKQASSQNLKLVELARRILDAEATLESLREPRG